jgi:hypothetical protein
MQTGIDIVWSDKDLKSYYSPMLNCRFYHDHDGSGAIFITVEQAAIACGCPQEDLVRSMNCNPEILDIDGQPQIIVNFAQFADFLHKFNPHLLANCLLVTALQTKI